MAGEKILIVDDDIETVLMMKDYLHFKGYHVLTAFNGEEALVLVKNDLPDLIILDVEMPNMGGLELCHHIKSDPKTRDISILMLSCRDHVDDKVQGLEKGADDYLSKPYNKDELLARIRAILRRSREKPFEPVEESLLHIYCRSNYPILIQCTGNINIIDMSKNHFSDEMEKFFRHASGLTKVGKDWRFHANDLGKRFFECLISAHPEINRVYWQAVGATPSKRDLHIKILSNREFINAPIESLFADAEYLCLQYPLVRTVEGVITKKQSISPSFFNNLQTEGSPLRILLIAANTIPPIPGVDQEVLKLQESIESAFTSKGLKVETKIIPSADAIYEKICQELHNSTYHVVHYCGHGHYDDAYAEKSALVFWEDKDLKRTKHLTATMLKALVENSEILFFYLSCCSGAATAPERQLLDDDFLGIADALVQAGIPSVLGFRWPVSDLGAIRLAVRFYDTLARDGRLDVSLLEARKFIERDDLTWLSPVLIAQK